MGVRWCPLPFWVITLSPPYHPLHGALAGAACWLGFAAAPSYATAVFSMQPKGLWLINSGYNLVSFMIAGAILGAWRLRSADLWSAVGRPPVRPPSCAER